MGCFIVPVAEAVISTIVMKVIADKEKKVDHLQVGKKKISGETPERMPFSRKMKWLSNMLWGGSALLAFEHVWHGEVTPWFPFLTAAGNPEATAEMLYEISTTGIFMACLVTAVWVAMVLVSSAIEKKCGKQCVTTPQEG